MDWLSASSDGTRLAVVRDTFAYVLDGSGRQLGDALPRGGIDVIAEMAPDGRQVATVELLPEISPAPVGSPPGTPGLSGFVPYLFVTATDGSGREATARSIIDIGWLGARLVRTDNARRRAVRGRALPAGGQHLPRVRARRRARSRRTISSTRRFSPDGRFAAVVQAPGTEIGLGPIVIYDAATGAARPHAHDRAGHAAVVVARRPVRRVRARQRHLRRAGRGRAASAACSPAASSPSGSPRRRAASAAIRPCASSGRSAIVTACAPQPGRVTVTLRSGGRRVARRTVRAATGGIVTVRFRRAAGRLRADVR